MLSQLLILFFRFVESLPGNASGKESECCRTINCFIRPTKGYILPSRIDLHVLFCDVPSGFQQLCKAALRVLFSRPSVSPESIHTYIYYKKLQ